MGGAYWTCQCDCGQTTEVSGRALRARTTYSCGCQNREILTARYKDETGRRYGKLLVLSLAGLGNYRRGGKIQGAQWLCRCDCGKEFVTRGSSLRAGVSTSCGCTATERLREAMQLPTGVSQMNAAVRSVHHSARSRGLDVTLTRDQIIGYFKSPCTYCGAVEVGCMQHPDANGPYRYNGIDRVDSSLGYTPENCVTCCKHCNYAKRDMPADDFRAWIKRCYETMFPALTA